MTSFTLELGAHEPFDLALDARRFVLWRQGSVVRLSLGPADLERVRRSLALRGVRTLPAEVDLPTPPPLVRAIGIGLAPARLTAGELDVVEVRVVPLGEAKEGSNVFKVYALTDTANDQWRPGMQGEARVDVEKRSLAWIWTHRLVEYVRLKLWI